MYEIAELMTRNIITINPDETVAAAIKIMVNNNITGIPVVYQDNTLAGMISERDVIRIDTKTDLDSPVNRWMTKDTISFDVSDDFIAVCEALVNNPVRRVPILSDGKIVGIISRRDLIKYLVEPI